MKTKLRWGSIVVLALVGACVVPMLWDRSETPTDVSQANHEFDYPEEWTRLGLPEIPDGKVISPGEGNFYQGFHFELTVNQSTDNVAEFFEEEMHRRWFDFFMMNLTTDGSYLNQFNSADVEITINALPDHGQAGCSTVRIGMRKAMPKRSPASFSSVRAD